MKQLILIFFLFSCNDSTTKTAPDNRIQVLQKEACGNACYHQYETFKASKQLNSKSISLTFGQITSLHENCLFFCNKEYFSEPVLIEETPEEVKTIEVEKKKPIKKPKKKKVKNNGFQTFEEMESI